MNEGSGTWVGRSGFEHVFHVYGRDESIPSRQGLFIYCKRDARGAWLPVYMGQGDLSRCCEDPDLLACIDREGATHIHMRLCASAEEREAELADLLGHHGDTFAPQGCNVVALAPGATPPGPPDAAAAVPSDPDPSTAARTRGTGA